MPIIEIARQIFKRFSMPIEINQVFIKIKVIKSTIVRFIKPLFLRFLWLKLLSKPRGEIRDMV